VDGGQPGGGPSRQEESLYFYRPNPPRIPAAESGETNRQGLLWAGPASRSGAPLKKIVPVREAVPRRQPDNRPGLTDDPADHRPGKSTEWLAGRWWCDEHAVNGHASTRQKGVKPESERNPYECSPVLAEREGRFPRLPAHSSGGLVDEYSFAQGSNDSPW